MSKGSFDVKVGLAEMLKGGVIMDVTNAKQAKIAEDAIIGYDACGYRVVYDYDKCLKVLMEADDRLSYPEAHEFMEFNVVGAYVGDFTPIFVHSLV